MKMQFRISGFSALMRNPSLGPQPSRWTMPSWNIPWMRSRYHYAADWSDVGSWAVLAEMSGHAIRDECDNVIQGDVVLQDTRNVYARSSEPTAMSDCSSKARIRCAGSISGQSRADGQRLRFHQRLLERLGQLVNSHGMDRSWVEPIVYMGV